jgi:hypothetical protein
MRRKSVSLYAGSPIFPGDVPVLKDNKFFIYGGGLLTSVAIALPTLPSDAAICIDNRVMCAPLALPMDDEPSGNEPQPLGTRSVLVAVTSTASLNVPFIYGNLAIRVR